MDDDVEVFPRAQRIASVHDALPKLDVMDIAVGHSLNGEHPRAIGVEVAARYRESEEAFRPMTGQDLTGKRQHHDPGPRRRVAGTYQSVAFRHWAAGADRCHH